jgi:hypothetical protein
MVMVWFIKKLFMKNSVQQEILLMTNSSLSKRSFCEINSSETGKQLSNVEKLENACWNGMLTEFLPGLVEKAEGKTLFLWEIQNAKNFLHIDLCDRPNSIDKNFSIDPYLFIDHLLYN